MTLPGRQAGGLAGCGAGRWILSCQPSPASFIYSATKGCVSQGLAFSAICPTARMAARAKSSSLSFTYCGQQRHGRQACRGQNQCVGSCLRDTAEQGNASQPAVNAVMLAAMDLHPPAHPCTCPLARPPTCVISSAISYAFVWSAMAMSTSILSDLR